METTEEKLTNLTSSPDGRAILFLTPLAVVAWMDGEPEMDELITLAGHHAGERCGEKLGCLSDEARQFFYFHFVYGRPSAQLVGLSLTLLAKALSKLPSKETAQTVEQLLTACGEVARTSGGGLLHGAVSEAEDRAIGEMLKYIRPRQVDAGNELAITLGFDNNPKRIAS